MISERVISAEALRSVVTPDRVESRLGVLELDDGAPKNEDGSIDFCFGPHAPASGRSNWLQAVPGHGFYPMVRFCTPTEGSFDETWALVTKSNRHAG